MRHIEQIVKAGHKRPAFLHRFKTMRFWLFKVPASFTVKNIKVFIKVDGEWITLAELDYERTAKLSYRLLTQINKAWGINWGFPRKTKTSATWTGESWHPNSHRLGFTFLDEGYCYNYTDGVHSEALLTKEEFASFVGYAFSWFSKLFAYALGLYIGGTETCPYDVKVCYDIDWEYAKPNSSWPWMRFGILKFS